MFYMTASGYNLATGILGQARIIIKQVNIFGLMNYSLKIKKVAYCHQALSFHGKPWINFIGVNE